jgi:uncharacterized membrane protein YfcA
LGVAIATWTIWLILLGPQTAFGYLTENWQVALTMVFGSAIAGGTSLGGGAVAFPVFTKLLHIAPQDAKLFSLAIQSVGMMAASLAIILTGIRVEWRAIAWGSLGGIFGIGLGAGFLAPWLPPDVIKMSFTLMLASFAITLLALNRQARQCHLALPIWTLRERGIIFGAGFAGGIMSGLVGNGIDIVVFSVMVLLFRISEKVATPTSVILMAVNAMIGFGLHTFVFGHFSDPARSYWLAAIPVVVVGAPLGAMFCNLLRRETIANILIGLIAIELVTSLLLIPLRPVAFCSSLATLAAWSCLNYWMYRNRAYQMEKLWIIDY